MIAWWMAQIALLAALLALAAWGTESALRTARRPTRWAWVAGLALLLGLGVSAPIRATGDVGAITMLQPTATAPRATRSETVAGPLHTLRTAWRTLASTIDRQAQSLWTDWQQAMPDDVERWMLLTWAAASAGVLTLFASVHWRYRRRRRHWPLGTVLGNTVRIASDTGPAVIGVTHAEIVVPRWLLGRDAAEQRLVLAHETEHLRQRDPLLLALAQLVVVLVPWHPAVWWMAARLRLAVELDCDRRVLQRGASARDYGTLLIELTDHRAGFGAALPAFSCSPSNLERRLVAMTSKPTRHPLVRTVAAGALASLALLAACEANLPTADEMDRMTASSATAAAGRVALVDTMAVTYYVNGVVTAKDAANAIPSDSITSVNVIKTTTGGSQVRIATRQPGDAPVGTRRTIDVDTVVRRGYGQIGVVATTDSAAIRVTIPSKTFNGLLIVDGVARESNAMSALAPDQIVSVDVIKGASATQQYSDPRAANGVIRITTKKAAKP